MTTMSMMINVEDWRWKVKWCTCPSGMQFCSSVPLCKLWNITPLFYSIFWNMGSIQIRHMNKCLVVDDEQSRCLFINLFYCSIPCGPRAYNKSVTCCFIVECIATNGPIWFSGLIFISICSHPCKLMVT